ncbi:hypothetical protein B0A49_09346 [Cryomyces minteri]|uniref:Ell binding protein Ebp1 C-terminal domain-containing protein n=1 Tax=Cryomyces minteri TaxID=331657 RepID=A0A4V5NHS8_9PEZI|nr:hypothetical protein B0A49_09346 [Cryomyces minteri]
MSIDTLTKPRAPAYTSPTSKLADDAEERRSVDAIVERISKVIPQAPYILTVPQDGPKYQHFTRESAESWLIGTPFHQGEDPLLQYQSFLYREHGSDCFVLRTEDEMNGLNGYPMGNGARTNGLPSGAAGLGGTPATEQHANAQKEGPKLHTEAKAVTEELEAPAVPQPPVPAQGTKRPLEETSSLQPPNNTARHASQPPAKKQRTSPLPPERMSKTETPVKNKEKLLGLPPILSPIRSSPGSFGLPPILSPTIPSHIGEELAKQRRKRTLSDASTLTPDASSSTQVPSSASKSINGIKMSPSFSATQNNDTLGPLPKGVAQVVKRGTLSSSQEQASEAKERPPTTETKPVSKVLSGSSESNKLDGNANVKRAQGTSKTSPPLKPTAPSRPAKRLWVVHSEDKGEEPTCIVRLKYRKSKAPEIRRYLNTRPTPDKKHVDMQNAKRGPKIDSATETKKERERSNEHPKQKAQHVQNERPKKGQSRRESDQSRDSAREDVKKVLPAKNGKDSSNKEHLKPSTQSAEKRPRPEDEEEGRPPAAKRQKAPAALNLEKNISTPLQPAFKSPAVSNMKSQQVTPRKDIRSAAMKRIDSSESLVRTPQNLTDAPTSGGTQVSGTTRPSPASGKGRTAESQAWDAENVRLRALGGELKHAAQSIQKSVKEGEKLPDKEAKLVAVTALESLLTYFLAFTAQENSLLCRAYPANDSAWHNLHGFYHYVRRTCEPFPHLKGLAYQLGFVYHAHITSILAKRPPTADLTASTNPVSAAVAANNRAATPASTTSNFSNISIATTATPIPPPIYATLASMHSYAATGFARLPTTALIAAYPATWKAQAAPDDAPETCKPGEYKGAFALPLGVQSSPLQAVRMGVLFLDEWVRIKLGGEYKFRLQL